MYRNTVNTVKGVGMGLLAGAVVAAVGVKTMNGGKKANQMKRSAGRAVHTVAGLLTDVEKMLK